MGRSDQALKRLWQGRRPLAAALTVATLGILAWKSLPDPLFAAPRSAALYDRTGVLLGARIADDGQWRFPAAAQVPEKYAAALVAFEDRRFYRHPGVDPLALLRALRQNLDSGKVVSGGSTLSMQVIRLVRAGRERSYAEKAIEAALALRLEIGYSKAGILALYAANAPFGGNVVGLEAAAWRYFGHTPERLSWAESATLAVLPNSPALIHPGRARDALLRKRDRLLGRLHAAGRIDRLQYTLALREPLPEAPRPLPRLAPHLLDTLAAEQGENRRYASTLDAALQRKVTVRVQQRAAALAGQGVYNTAALVIDNATLQVQAYVGNSPQPSGEERGYAVDIVRRPRSTGSLLKPFLFAAMLQDGQIVSSSLVPDVPMHFAGFRPENFDRRYRGAVRARDALAQSLNVPAVYLLRQYGLERYYDLLRHMGMSTLYRLPEDYGLPLILGGAEGTLWDLGAMYANLAHLALSGAHRGQAHYHPLQSLLGPAPVAGPATDLGAGAAWLTLEALQEVSRPELEQYWKSFSSSRRIAWKTGTSHGLRDGWAIGVTPRHTIAVWVGNASGEGRAGLTGAGMAAPLLFDILDLFGDEGWFASPLSDLRRVQVCRDDGYLPGEGCEREAQWLPVDAHFERVSRYHQTVHLDPAGQWRVDGRCQSVGQMQHRTWFVLPPAQEYYFRLHETGYRGLPPVRPDCQDALAGERSQSRFDIVYPEPGAVVYIPTDLGAQRGRVVFEAVHRDRAAVLHWHLDDRYLQSTRVFHKLALDIAPGEHRLTVVDQDGSRQMRRFTVLAGEHAVEDGAEPVLAPQ